MSDTVTNGKISDVFADLLKSKRLPHAVLIEGTTDEIRQQAAWFLAGFAVCKGENKPCKKCSDCLKSEAKAHPDIIVPKSSGKTNIITMETMRDIIMAANIVTNEADTKVFILNDVDKRMKPDVQNAFLKILEEPPLSALFVLTCESSKRMLKTILSRVQVFSLKAEAEPSDEIKKLSKEIISGILSLDEMDLILATEKLKSRDSFKEVLPVVSEYLRLALIASLGVEESDDTALLISRRITKSKIISLIDTTTNAIVKADSNVNCTLLSTWLCTEYRRISWQK